MRCAQGRGHGPNCTATEFTEPGKRKKRKAKDRHADAAKREYEYNFEKMQWSTFLTMATSAAAGEGGLRCPVCQQWFDCNREDPYPLWQHVEGKSLLVDASRAGHPPHRVVVRWVVVFQRSLRSSDAGSSRRPKKPTPWELERAEQED